MSQRDGGSFPVRSYVSYITCCTALQSKMEQLGQNRYTAATETINAAARVMRNTAQKDGGGALHPTAIDTNSFS